MFNISIVIVAYNGYGVYLPRLIESIRQQTVKPTEIIVVLSDNHGLTKELEGVKIIEAQLSKMGTLRNAGINKAIGEWILYFSADDVLLPNAIEEIQNKSTSDIVALKYFDRDEIKHTPEVKRELMKQWEKLYIGTAGYVAFKKGLRYDNTNFPNFPLLFRAMDNGYKFTVTDNPCAIYCKRYDSHSQQGLQDKGIKEIGKYAKRYISN